MLLGGGRHEQHATRTGEALDDTEGFHELSDEVLDHRRQVVWEGNLHAADQDTTGVEVHNHLDAHIVEDVPRNAAIGPGASELEVRLRQRSERTEPPAGVVDQVGPQAGSQLEVDEPAGYGSRVGDGVAVDGESVVVLGVASDRLSTGAR